MMMTREEYISSASASREEARAAHRRYYGQFVNRRTIDYVVRVIGSDALLASTDPHFNDIPLDKWDRIALSLPLAASLRDAGDYMTLAGGVCIAKEAARQYVESQQS
jgi:hypothetical protein